MKVQQLADLPGVPSAGCPAPARAMENTPNTQQKPQVLVIDDEAHVRTILRDILTTMGFDVIGEGGTGLEAVELYRALRPDLMLLDINMPVMTGEEALMVIMPEFSDALVVMLTSMTDAKSVETCLNLGAVNYIRKDTSLAEIRNIIEEALKLK
ncbi:MAG: response regulator [Kiritimatiellae bacterium]|nr:response regulator [Kiritimatiellia bacterium]